MANSTKALKSKAWTLFDRIVDEAITTSGTPWAVEEGQLTYRPDEETLKLLLRVPALLGSNPRSGVPALALDVWVAYELRRAGFEPDSVWPRAEIPRILPGSISRLLSGMKRDDAERLRELLASGDTFKGTVGASAKVLGKNYMKQVDVVISDWDTGPELLISTKRMDDSYGNNAPNRVEESYGDAKNLRSRHPLAALGFAFSLRSDAFIESPRVADWIIDLLAKLGREDDAYDAVTLIVPKYSQPLKADAEVIDEEVVNEELIEIELEESPAFEPTTLHGSESDFLFSQLLSHPPVELEAERVPYELSPSRFFTTLITHVLDNSPITRHELARELVKELKPIPRRF